MWKMRNIIFRTEHISTTDSIPLFTMKTMLMIHMQIDEKVSDFFFIFKLDYTLRGTLAENKPKIVFIKTFIASIAKFISRYLNKSIRDSIQDHSETSNKYLHCFEVCISDALVANSIYLMGDDFFSALARVNVDSTN